MLNAAAVENLGPLHGGSTCGSLWNSGERIQHCSFLLLSPSALKLGVVVWRETVVII